MRGIIAVACAVTVGAILGATILRDEVAYATRLAQSVTIDNTPSQSIPMRGVGRVIPIADNLSVPANNSPGNPAFTPWVDTSDCQRVQLVVRGSGQSATSAGTEFFTSIDGVTADTWWTRDSEDNHNFIAAQSGWSNAYVYSFSFHGEQPAAARFARASFGHGNATTETVDKAWIYCVR